MFLLLATFECIYSTCVIETTADKHGGELDLELTLPEPLGLIVIFNMVDHYTPLRVLSRHFGIADMVLK